MIDWLESIDRSIVLTVNSWNTPFLDEVCWILSARWPWIPLYLLLFYFSWKQLGTKKSAVFLFVVIVTIVLADTTSVYFFKENFQRYRPSHHALLTNRLHFYNTAKAAVWTTAVYKAMVYLIYFLVLYFNRKRLAIGRTMLLVLGGLAVAAIAGVFILYAVTGQISGAPEYYKGGMYGFVSSHATNFFVITVIMGLSLKENYPNLLRVLLAISVIVCFSRLYLGAHYLSDLVGGAFWGTLIALVSYRFIIKPYILTPKR